MEYNCVLKFIKSLSTFPLSHFQTEFFLRHFWHLDCYFALMTAAAIQLQAQTTHKLSEDKYIVGPGGVMTDTVFCVICVRQKI